MRGRISMAWLGIREQCLQQTSKTENEQSQSTSLMELTSNFQTDLIFSPAEKCQNNILDSPGRCSFQPEVSVSLQHSHRMMKWMNFADESIVDWEKLAMNRPETRNTVRIYLRMTRVCRCTAPYWIEALIHFAEELNWMNFIWMVIGLAGQPVRKLCAT